MMQTKFNIGDKVQAKAGFELTIAKIEIGIDGIKYYFEERNDKYSLTEAELRDENFYKVVRKGVIRPLDERYGVAYCKLKEKNISDEVNRFLELSQEVVHDSMERAREWKIKYEKAIEPKEAKFVPAGIMEYYFGPDNYFFDAVCGGNISSY